MSSSKRVRGPDAASSGESPEKKGAKLSLSPQKGLGGFLTKAQSLGTSMRQFIDKTAGSNEGLDPASSSIEQPEKKDDEPPPLSHRVLETARFQECFQQIRVAQRFGKRPAFVVYGLCTECGSTKQRNQAPGEYQHPRNGSLSDFRTNAQHYIGTAVRRLIDKHADCHDPPLDFASLEAVAKAAPLREQVL